MPEEQQTHQDEHHEHPGSKVTVEHVDRMAVEKSAPFAIPFAIVVAGAIIGAALYFGKGPSLPSGGTPTPPGQPSAPNVQGGGGGEGAVADITTGDMPVLGDPNAPVTIVEFSDYQCPFCERFFETVEPSLRRDYIDTGKAKFAYRDFAFLGPESLWAANAARCANEQGKFWEYHDKLFTEQAGENEGAFSKDNLKRFGREIGLDTAQFNACVDSGKHEAAVTADVEAGRTAGVNGTPATFINGRMVSGAQPYQNFQTIIDEELNK